MIEINLLPEELRAKPKTKKQEISVSLGKSVLFIPLLIGILICAHVYLTALSLIKTGQYRKLNNAWKKLEPQKKMLDSLSNENDYMSDTAKNIQKISEQRLIWAEKLNKLSSNLPSGIWFSEISLSSSGLVIMCSVVSLQNNEMNLIAKLIDNLKNDTGFFKGFSSLQLGPVQHKIVGSYDIADFTIIGILNTK